MRALIASAIVCVASIAAATPTQDLDRARTSFRNKDFASAIPVLNTLLYPELQLTRQEEVIEAQIMLGASYYETGNRERAVREFENALQLEPDRSITTLLYSEGAVRLFEDTKRDVQARIERDAERKRLAEVRAKLEEYRKSLIVYETRPYYVNFVPFGAGQFQNKQRGKGLFFASTQGVTGGVSAGIFLYLASKYGLVAKVPLVEGPTVRRLQQIEIGTGIAFLGFYAWGVVDSLLHYKPRAQIKGDDSLLPEDMRELAQPPPKLPKTSLRLGPVLLPSGAGIGLSLENF